MKEHENIYWAARMRAAERAPIFSSRERTAAALYISTDTLRDIERGISAAPCDVVQKMCELYEDTDLKAQHIRAVCPLLADYGGSGYGELALAALNWAVQLADVQTVTLQFATIASDGRINPHEREAARAIRARAVTFRQVMEDTIEAIDKAMNRRNGQ